MEIYENFSLEDIEGEIWKDIKGFEGLYQVSNMGRVKSLNYNKTKKPGILKPFPNDFGYLRVILSVKGKTTVKPIHRLVAMMFIDNPLNKATVDHINTIVTDNRLCNLRWLTSREQLTVNEITKERERKNLEKAVNATKRKVKCLTTNKTFNSVTEGAQYYNIKYDETITRCCRGKQHFAGEYNGVRLKWQYID